MFVPLAMNDVTVFPPPTLTPQRAYEIYTPAFRRVMEYVTISRVPGDILEFGTFRGYTGRTFAELMRECNNPNRLFMYDSFEGFPEMVGNDAICPEVAIHKTWNKGDCFTGIAGIENIIKNILLMILPGRVDTIKGFYEQTIPSRMAPRASVIHIDCDLYSSTHHVLTQLIEHNVMSDGCVVLFDEFNNNFASNKFAERRVMRDIFPKYHEGEWWMDKAPYLSLEQWFTYGSSGYAFILHHNDKPAA